MHTAPDVLTWRGKRSSVPAKQTRNYLNLAIARDRSVSATLACTAEIVTDLMHSAGRVASTRREVLPYPPLHAKRIGKRLNLQNTRGGSVSAQEGCTSEVVTDLMHRHPYVRRARRERCSGHAKRIRKHLNLQKARGGLVSARNGCTSDCATDVMRREPDMRRARRQRCPVHAKRTREHLNLQKATSGLVSARKGSTSEGATDVIRREPDVLRARGERSSVHAKRIRKHLNLDNASQSRLLCQGPNRVLLERW